MRLGGRWFECPGSHAGSIEKARMPQTPRNFGEYVLLGEMGRGASGVVYQAIQTRLNRPVALKVLRAGSADDEPSRQRFLREAEAAASLHHPHIVPVFEAGAVNGELFLSMKPFAGGSLAERLTERSYVPRKAAQLLTELACATHFAHTCGVLHRDIKPGNILLDEQGAAFLGDFGIAKMLEAAESATALTAVIGTPAYLAPEVAAEGARAATTASDIYSLGAVLYELLTGRPPHQGKDPLAVLQRVVTEDIVAPRKARRQQDTSHVLPTAAPTTIPEDLEVICLKCLERNPGRRYATAADLVEDLGRFLRGEPVKARPLSPLERAWRWCGQHPARAALLGVTVLGFIGGGCGVVWQWQQAERHAARVREAYLVQQRQAIEQHLERDDVSSGLSLLAVALQQDPADAAKVRRAMSVMATHTFPLPLVPPLRHAEPVRGAGFLPGDREVFAVSGTKVCFWNPGSGQPTRELVTDARLRTASPHPDGTTLLTVSDNGRVTLWSLTNWQSSFSTRLEEPLCAAGWGGLGQSVFLLGQSGQLRQYDRSGRAQAAATVWAGPWRAAAGQPGGELLAALAADGRIRFWSFREQKESGPAIALREVPQNLLFSPSGGLIMTLGRTRGSANFFDVRTRQRLNPQPLHDRHLEAAAFSPEGLRLVGVVDAVNAAVWELLPRRRGSEWLRHDKPIHSVAFSHDGRRVITGSEDGTAVIWSALAGEMQPIILPTAGLPAGLAFAGDGQSLNAAATDGRELRWGVGRSTWDGPAASVAPPASKPLPGKNPGQDTTPPWSDSPNGVWQVVTSANGEVRLSAKNGMNRGDRVLPLRGSVRRLAFNRSGSVLVVGRAAGGISFYDTETLLPAAEPIRAHPDLLDLAVSSDDRWIAASHADGAIRAWRCFEAPPAPASHSLIRLVAAVGGQDHRPDGTMRYVTPSELYQVCSELREHSGEGTEAEFIRWFLADRQQRPAAPGTSATAAENLDAAIRVGFTNFPVRMAALFPNHPAALRRAADFAARTRRLPGSELAWVRGIAGEPGRGLSAP